MINRLNQETFNKLLMNLHVPNQCNSDFLYKIYDYSIEGIDELSKQNEMFHIEGINQIELVNYCIGEYIYTTAVMNKDQRVEFENNEDNISLLASVICDKYLTLSMFNYQNKKMMNKYLPPISTLNLYLNFIMNVLDKAPKNDPSTTLVIDLLTKSVSISRCILNLLLDGYVTEAYASWRTLHECECTLLLLEKYGEPLIALYLRHMTYAIAYKNGINSQEETDKIFTEIKAKMAEHNLKSKDMKKFIEYGWLFGIKEFNENPNAKLNFKDGLEVVSGLSRYGDSYNLSSEIVHATPMLIYSNKDYFYYVTLLSLYEGFFRLERVFTTLFAPRVKKEHMESYIKMRNMYYSHLVNIYTREQNIFASIKKLNKKS